MKWTSYYLSDFRLSRCRQGSCLEAVPGSDSGSLLSPKVSWKACWRVELPPLRETEKC